MLLCIMLSYFTMTDSEMNSPEYSVSSPTYEYAEVTNDAPMSLDVDPNTHEDRRGSSEDCRGSSEDRRGSSCVDRRGSSYVDRRGSSYVDRRGSSYVDRRGSSYVDRRGSSRRGSSGNRRHTSNEIVYALKKEGTPVSERRLGRWFPEVKISQILIQCKNVRFTRDKTGGRLWEYESDRAVENDVYDAVDDGLSSLSDIQYKVQRRFAVVRTAPDTLVDNRKKLTRSETNGEMSWNVTRS
jgi:hypothetical protein